MFSFYSISQLVDFRSIDIAIDNQIERLQYLRLMAHFCDSIPNCIPISLIRPLIAVATDGADERDKLTKASVGLLCELSEFLYPTAQLMLI